MRFVHHQNALNLYDRSSSRSKVDILAIESVVSKYLNSKSSIESKTINVIKSQLLKSKVLYEDKLRTCILTFSYQRLSRENRQTMN